MELRVLQGEGETIETRFFKICLVLTEIKPKQLKLN